MLKENQSHTFSDSKVFGFDPRMLQHNENMHLKDSIIFNVTE
jgi:hypothetical protein